jgi:hypothetical protein
MGHTKPAAASTAHGKGTTAVGVRARQRDQESNSPFPPKAGAQRCKGKSNDIDNPTPSALATSTTAVDHGNGSAGAARLAACPHQKMPPSRTCTVISELSPARPIPATACLFSLVIARRCAAATQVQLGIVVVVPIRLLRECAQLQVHRTGAAQQRQCCSSH